MGRREQESSGSPFMIVLLVAIIGAACWWLLLGQSEAEIVPEAVETTVSAEITPEIVPEVVPEPEVEEEIVVEEDPMPTLPEGTEDWQIIIASKWYPLDADPEMELVQVEDYSVDSRIVEALEQMLADCRAAGFTPKICSAYRSYEVQERLYNNKVDRVLAADPTLSIEEAMEVAATEVAVPGGSEHQTGLTLDIVDINYQILDETQANTATQQWLMEHCWDYGFILRYPLGYSDITGIIYEPWHYRYVGYDIAQEMLEEQVVFETYLAERGLYVFPEELAQ
ncbi:M15 family metallopeptidase [Bengtsoniella intestinalis]|uniref:M15 family metallopeptidase n=1 Tax=Bengtsoniella intestinalis TaxID=3073143 RepID=UPI00391F1549